MKKKITITLSLGFIAVISGLILCGIGYFMGGIEDLETIATPSLTEETYPDIREIKLEPISRPVRLEQSPDNQFHIRYANVDSLRHHTLTLEQANQTLILEEKDTNLHIKGIMQFLGQELALRRDQQLQELTILVPKGKTIEKLSGRDYFTNSFLTLNNVHIKELDWSGYVNGDNVTMADGAIHSSTSGSLHFTNSHLKNMTIDASVDTQLYQASILENVKIQKAGSVHLHDTTILGTTQVETSGFEHAYLHINLSEKSKKDTQLDLSVTYNWEQLRKNYYYPNSYTEDEIKETFDAQEEEFQKEHLEQMGIKLGSEYKDLKIEENQNGAKATYTPKETTNKLTIQSTNGQIILGEFELGH